MSGIKEILKSSSKAMIDNTQSNSSNSDVFDIGGFITPTDENSHIPRNMHSNFTEDSSLSSTYSPLYSNHVTTKSQSPSDSMCDLGRVPSPPIGQTKSNALPNMKMLIGDMIPRDANTDCKSDLFYSQASNSSQNDKIVNVTKASELNLGSVVPNFLSEINGDSDVIRTPFESLPSNDVTNLPSPSNKMSNFKRYYNSTGVQTLPVLILPLVKETGNRRIDKKADVKVKFDDRDSKSNDTIRSKTKTEKSKIPTSQKETQAPPLPPSRTRTSSEFTVGSKDKETTDALMESSLKTLTNDVEEKKATSDVFWGDVFNDYQHACPETVEVKESQRPESVTQKVKLRNKPKQIDPGTAFKDGDVVINLCDLSAQNKDVNHPSSGSVIRSQTPKLIYKRKGNSVSLKMQENGVKSADNKCFQKLFELHQFDDMVKSYLNTTDRRIRSICSKSSCIIRMYGPIVQSLSEGSKLLQPVLHVKTLYYISISAETKECLDKSIKCIQETFPKSFLNEKYTNQTYLDICREEIPI